MPAKNNPIQLFGQWFDEAKNTNIKEPTAMALATADAKGQPSVRMVLMKDFGEGGFVFYTNRESNKGQQLDQNRKAALCFYWMPMNKQVRVIGAVEIVTDDEADAYFATRPRLAQLGAWASRQSRPMSRRFDLEKKVAFYAAKFGVKKIPRPPYWIGYRLVPEQIEFWTQKPFRLHERILYTRQKGGWKVERLFP